MQGVFDNKGNYLNANILGRSLHGENLLYSLSSTKSMFRGRKVTTLTSSSTRRPVGAIHWRDKRFEVLGKVIPWDTLKTKGGFFSNARLWRWSRQQYKLKFTNRRWMASVNGSAVAHFRPYVHHIFSKNEPATLHWTLSSQEDEIFLILVFLYSEVKRQDSEKSRRNAVGTGSPGISPGSPGICL